jgi:hypothetical protein
MRRIVFAFIALVSISAQAATYVVSITGTDGSAGSSAAPWRTLQYAADTIAAGDTVIVTPGSYAGFNLAAGGLPGLRKVFSAQPGVLINQRGNSTSGFINLEAASHVVVEGFEITGAQRFGIRAVGVDASSIATDVIIRGNTVRNSAVSNIFTGFVANLRIEDNVVHGAVEEHGIYVSNSADNHVVRNNVSYGNSGAGIQLNGDASQGGDGIISNALIENNRIYQNGTAGGSAINLDGVRNSVIQNNLLYENHASGISLFRIDGGAGSAGNLVANNTIINATNGRWALNIQDGSTDNTTLNNILFSRESFRGAIDISADSLAGFVSDHNILEAGSTVTVDAGDNTLSLSQWSALTGNDLNTSAVDPAQLMALFVNYAGQDFQLADGSLALDTGIAGLLNGTLKSAPLYDLLMSERPAGAGFDVGAFEAQPIPEASTWMMMLAGCALVGWAGRRRNSYLRTCRPGLQPK